MEWVPNIVSGASTATSAAQAYHLTGQPGALAKVTNL